MFGRHPPCSSSQAPGRIAAFLLPAAALLAFACAAAAQPVTAFDAQGNVYLASSAESAALTTPGAFQSSFNVATCSYFSGYPPFGITVDDPCPHGYIRKATPDGSTLLVATYLEGTGQDEITALALDPAGDIYVTGTTTSTDFPVTAGAYLPSPASCFVSEISADATQLLHSTYLNCVTVNGLALDSQGRILVAGTVSAGADGQNPYLFAFAPDLSAIVYSALPASIAGGTALSVAALAVDNTGVYVTGSGGTPAQVFLTKLDNFGNPLWSFAFGGAADSANTLSLDAAGESYIVGIADSSDFPVTPGAFRLSPDPLAPPPTFAVKVSADGAHFLYSALLASVGGPIQATVDSTGALLIAARVQAADNFPTTPDAILPCLTVQGEEYGGNAFLKLAPDGSAPLYGTYLPGLENYAIGIAPSGRVLLTGGTQQFVVADTSSLPSQR
jgi:hypothetical protein